MNARYALNAANARWGSLYDALYGTDAIPEDGGAERGKGYNPERGKSVDRLRAQRARRGGAARRRVAGRTRRRFAVAGGELVVTLGDRAASGCKDPERFAGYQGSETRPRQSCCSTTACTSRSVIDRNHPIGKSDPAGIADIVVEAAMTTIMDFEDSIAAVDAEDKVAGLSQLARPDEGRPHRRVREGRQDGRRGRSTPTASSSRRTAARSRCPAAA